jgi:large subunit ribosomal protein L4
MAMQVDVLSPASGSKVGDVTVDEKVFGITPNVPVMHQVVVGQLAGIRQGDQSTLTRAEVRGGGRKPWRQKGSGRARQGSSRAPHWRGGGVALGPKPRSYAQRTPKKMVQLALRSALSDRAAMGRVGVVEAWDFPTPKTKDARKALAMLGLTGKILVVLDRDQDTAERSFRNLPEVHTILASELNAYDVLCCDWIVFTRSNVPAPRADATPAAAAATSTGDES